MHIPKATSGHYSKLAKFALGQVSIENFASDMLAVGRENAEKACDEIMLSTSAKIAKVYSSKEKADDLFDDLHDFKTPEEIFLNGLKRISNFKSGYLREVPKLVEFEKTGTAQWSIFADGNVKLSFLAWSTLPAITCAGAGDCLNWCYSFKSWRYFSAFCRQYQATKMLQTAYGRQQIAADLDRHAPKVSTVRLYVDGDFDSVETMGFWFAQMRKHKNLSFYGYSKSLQTFLEYAGTGASFPSNYLLNLSEGHKYSDHVVAKVEQLPIVRGAFNVVSLKDWKGKIYDADHKTTPEARFEISKRYRALTGKASFACPNRCDTCTPKGHACGSSRFTGVDVVAAIH